MQRGHSLNVFTLRKSKVCLLQGPLVKWMSNGTLETCLPTALHANDVCLFLVKLQNAIEAKGKMSVKSYLCSALLSFLYFP